MTDSLGSMMEALRPHPSSLRKQVEARHESAAEFSFYGPAGSDFGQTTCKPRTKDSGHFSPGPARYNYLSMTPERVRRAASVVACVCVLGDAVDRLFPPSAQLSKKSRTPCHVFSLRATWDDKQIARLNQHRAKQQDWRVFRRPRSSGRPRSRSSARARRNCPRPRRRPSSGNFNTSDIQAKFVFHQYPRCHFGQSTTSRPFFDPLPNSCQSTIRERLRRHNPAATV